MTIHEMHSWFDILQMKGVNAEFTVSEKNHIINRAQIKFVNEVLQTKYLPSLKANEKAELVYSTTESVISGYDYIQPLLGVVVMTADAEGGIYFSAINSEIDSKLITLTAKPAGYSGSKLMTILGVAHKNTDTPLRYVNGYDRYKSKTNIYRQPKNYDPVYQIEENHINIDPNTLTIGGGVEFVVHFIREPEPVFHSNDRVTASIDCELPNFTHDEILSIALDDAGVVKRDQALMTLNKANKENLSASF